MPTYFDLPDEPTLEILTTALNTYHVELVMARVNVGIIICRKETNDGFSMEAFPPVSARIKSTSRKTRLHCEHDAIIEICHMRWESYSRATQLALIDHELTHLEVKEKDGEIKKDDLGRPLLKMRKDEIELTAFAEVIARHGENALDWKSIKNAHEKAETALRGETASVEPLPGAVGEIIL